jgi:hypothetical protein
VCEKYKITINQKNENLEVEGSNKEWVEGNALQFLDKMKNKGKELLHRNNHIGLIYVIISIPVFFSWFLMKPNLFNSLTKKDIIFIWYLGFFVSIFIGHYITRYINRKLRSYIGVEPANNQLTPSIGCIERLVYTLLFYYGQYELIAGLFGIMIVQRLIAINFLNKIEPSRTAISMSTEISKRINVFLISNFVSLFFGVLGGFIIKSLINSIFTGFYPVTIWISNIF